MTFNSLPTLFFIVLLAACSSSLLEDASAQYKRDKEYRSLQVIVENLSKGMPRKDVERLLGEPDYSPTNGQYYYSSSQSAYSKDQGRSVPVGLIVDYRDKSGELTATLHEFSLGPIGE